MWPQCTCTSIILYGYYPDTVIIPVHLYLVLPSKVGPVSHGGKDVSPSPATQKLIDDEVKRLLKVSGMA